ELDHAGQLGPVDVQDLADLGGGAGHQSIRILPPSAARTRSSYLAASRSIESAIASKYSASVKMPLSTSSFASPPASAMAQLTPTRRCFGSVLLSWSITIMM